MRCRRKIIIRVIVFVALGAIVNVAVAWAFALALNIHASPRAHQSFGITFPDADDFNFWIAQRTSVTGATRIRCSWPSTIANSSTPLSADDVVAGWLPLVIAERRGADTIIMDARGWPTLSMFSVAIEDTARVAGPYWRTVYEYRGAMVASEWPSVRAPQFLTIRPVPLSPLWPGFAINTIFYAAVLWVVWLTPGFVRRRIRHFRGRCIHCGYDLRGHVMRDAGQIICPECAVPSSR